jgi:hypothetical protein
MFLENVLLELSFLIQFESLYFNIKQKIYIQNSNRLSKNSTISHLFILIIHHIFDMTNKHILSHVFIGDIYRNIISYPTRIIPIRN